MDFCVRGKIDARLETAAAAELGLDVKRKGGAIEAKAKVDKAAASPDLVLNIVLAEKELTYSGENGIRQADPPFRPCPGSGRPRPPHR